jgi:Fe-S-cluster containining protein
MFFVNSMKKFSPLKITRPKEKTSVKDCGTCAALCCHDLSVEIKRPRTKDEIEDYKWRLHYDTVGIYIRNMRWHMIVKGRCQYLDEKNLCTIYDRRDEVCREHMPPDCERFEGWYDVLFTKPEEMEAYLDKSKKKKKKKSKPPAKRRRSK